MNYILTRKLTNIQNAGFKAPDDVLRICKSLGWNELCFYNVKNKHSLKVLDYFENIISNIKSWLNVIFITNSKDYILYQHPMYFGTIIAIPFLKLLNLFGRTTVVLIHDVEHLRTNNISIRDKEKELYLLNSFSRIICHNKVMKDYLVSTGIKAEKIFELNVFDYLSDSNIVNAKEHDEVISIVIAGNLDPNKSSYIYDLAKSNPMINFNLYGVNYVESNISNVNYMGKYDPDELPGVIIGNYGLIWDGDSLDACRGIMGDYLKINNPHKLSLYMASGLPVIVWSESAIASFISKNDCGIIVDNLYNLIQKLPSPDSNEFNKLMNHSIIIGNELRNGHSLKRVFSDLGATNN